MEKTGMDKCNGCGDVKPMSSMTAWCRGWQCAKCLPAAQARLSAARDTLARRNAVRKATDPDSSQWPEYVKAKHMRELKKAALAYAHAEVAAKETARHEQFVSATLSMVGRMAEQCAALEAMLRDMVRARPAPAKPKREAAGPHLLSAPA